MSFESDLKEKSDYYVQQATKRGFPDNQVTVYAAAKLTNWIKLFHPEKEIEMDDVVKAMSEAVSG